MADDQKNLKEFSTEDIPFTDSEAETFLQESSAFMSTNDDCPAELYSSADNGPMHNVPEEQKQTAVRQNNYQKYSRNNNQQNNGYQQQVDPQDRIYLRVPYAEKDEAKSYGARWDPARRQWYIDSSIDTTSLKKWMN